MYNNFVVDLIPICTTPGKREVISNELTINKDKQSINIHKSTRQY